MLPKSTEGRKLVIHEQLGTKPAAEYRSGELEIQKKKQKVGVKCTVTVKNILF